LKFKNKRALIGLWCFVGIWFLIFTISFFDIHKNLRIQKQAHISFKPVKAEVISFHIESTVNANRQGRSLNLKLLYRYNIDGVIYSSTIYSFVSPRDMNPYEIEKQFQRDSHVIAWYDPFDPSVSIIDNFEPDEWLYYQDKLPFWIAAFVFLLFAVLLTLNNRIKNLSKSYLN